MILYKNVDISDLESIMKNGILSIDKYGNNNWEEGKRSDNDTCYVKINALSTDKKIQEFEENIKNWRV